MKIVKPDPSGISRAAELLRKGGLVAFPTETVYGLGADAFNKKAVCRIFEVKKRPSFDPLIVHVASIPQAVSLWSDTPPLALRLMKKFWPGPLSIVLPKKPAVPDVVTAGLETVAVRMPDHPAALRLIRAAGCPVAAPSANLFGYTSPTAARSVAEDLGSKIDLVIDGGPSKVGVESTVIKIEGGRIVLLRPGGITVEQIEKASGRKVRTAARSSKLESPGRMKSHYAPRTPLVLIGGSSAAFMKKLEKLKDERKKLGRRLKLALISFSAKPPEGLFSATEVLSPKRDLYQAATRLFQAMRKLDKMKPDVIVAEDIPASGIGLAIADRLLKASAGKTGWNGFLRLTQRLK